MINMEIYKELKLQHPKNLKNYSIANFPKNKIEEGKIVEGKVAKITDKVCFFIY